MPRPRSLGHHLMQAALVATLLPLSLLCALGLWEFRGASARVDEFTGAESRSSAKVVAGFLGFLVAETRDSLQRVAKEAASGTATEALVKRESDNQPQTDGIEITDATGTISVSAIGHRGRDVSTAPYFTSLRAGAPVAYSDVFSSPWLHQQAVMIAVPYRRGGLFGGIVMARLNVATVNKLLSAHLADPWLRSTYVVDHQGVPITHPDLAVVNAAKPMPEAVPILAARRSPEGWLRTDGAIAGYVLMPETGWTVISTRQSSGTLLLVEEFLRNQLLLAGLSALLMGALALVWGRRLARPIERLEAAMRDVQRAGFDAPLAAEALAPSDVTEFGTLAAGCQVMLLELNRRYDAIREASRLKSEFLATMSHELRTPLNSIIGFTQLALTDPHLALDEETRTNLELVLKSARHLLELINGVLDLSKIEAGKAAIHGGRFDPARLVEAVVATVAPQADQKGLTLVVEAPAGLPEVESDETKVRQIVLNLVSNAVKFTREGRVTVRLAAEADRWRVAVEDTGPGIRPEDLEAIFEEFRQLDGSTTREVGGTGLGLAIARKLARLLGGDLAVASVPGQGSTFSLVLPMTALGPNEVVVPAAPSLPLPTRDERPVLALDEDPQSLLVLTETLRAVPCLPVPAGRWSDALALARVVRPGVVVLDIKSRSPNAWATLRELKADPATAELPVIALGFDPSPAAALREGATVYLPKPIDPHSLRQALARYMPIEVP